MKSEIKHQLIKTLKFLKNHQDIDKLTLSEIQERMIQYESLLIEFIETILEDKEDLNGTLTTWWLFEDVTKQFYLNDPKGITVLNVESAEDFVNYMIESSKPVG